MFITLVGVINEENIIPASGSKGRGECDFNWLYDLEKEGQKGKCT